MKKRFFFQTLLLLCALIAGSGGVWAEEKTSTLTFTDECGGTGTADDGVVWTVTSDGAESTYGETSGIHYGTDNAEVQYVELSTSGISGTISKSLKIERLIINKKICLTFFSLFFIFSIIHIAIHTSVANTIIKKAITRTTLYISCHECVTMQLLMYV